VSSHDIYPSLSAAKASWRHLEVVSNNLANVTSTGFKEQRVAFELQDRGDRPLESSYVQLDTDGADFSDGPLSQTGVATNLALQGRGFLVAMAGDGEQVLVRSGALRLDADNRLTTAGGEPILGEGGPIEIPIGYSFEVGKDGQVYVSRGDGRETEPNVLDKLMLVDADQVTNLGGSRFRAVSELRDAEGVEVIQGALELSNSDPMRNMVDLIQASRHFDIYQRAIRTSDETDARLYSTIKGG
jgi:flagellar basal-body rod protein FlgF